MKDWKTTLVGAVVIAIGALHCFKSGTLDAESLGLLTAGAGLICAKDSK